MKLERSDTRRAAWLIPLSVEDALPLALEPKPEGVVFGRHESCDVHVATNQASRLHAQFSLHHSTWRIEDLRSLWGTWVNGVRVPPGSSIALRDGDLVRMGTLYRFSLALDEEGWKTTTNEIADFGTHMSLPADVESTDSAVATSEDEMVQTIVQALAATGLIHAALLHYKQAGRQVRVLASISRPDAEPSSMYSRLLIHAASQGQGMVTRRCDQLYGPPLLAAAAVPIILCGRDVDCVIYVVAGADRALIDSEVLATCWTVARWAGHTLERLRANDAALLLGAVEVEHARAAEVQRRLLPARSLTADSLHCVGRLAPGYQLAGDFFDIAYVGAGRVAVALGDVSGKGIVASVLAAAAMGYLRSTLEAGAEPLDCTYALNRYIASHTDRGMFLTLWLGMLDGPRRILRYVDAGHGYAALIRSECSPVVLCDHGGLPLGIMADASFEAGEVPLEPGDRLLVISDGIVEQKQRSAPDRPLLFGFDRAVECLSSGSRLLDIEAAVDEVFSRVQLHASSRALDDDATAIAVQLGNWGAARHW